jgi:hypothetical protein
MFHLHRYSRVLDQGSQALLVAHLKVCPHIDGIAYDDLLSNLMLVILDFL